jgi:hypothetical protein
VNFTAKCRHSVMCPMLLQCAEQVWSWTIGDKNTEFKIKNLMILPLVKFGAALSCLPYELHISSSVLYSVGKLLSKSSRLPRTEATGPETYRANLTCTRIPPPSPDLTKSRAPPLPCAASLPCAAVSPALDSPAAIREQDAR